MEKTLKVGDQEVKLRSSVLTIITYKNTFGSDLFNDVSKLNVSRKNGISNPTHVIQTLFQIIYALHKPFTKKNFEEFLNDFDFGIVSDEDTITAISDVIGELLASQKRSGSGKVNP